MPKTTPPANELALQRMVAQPANRAKALAQQQSGAIAGSVPTGTESTGFATPASATDRVAADYGILQPYGSGTGTGQWMTSGVGYETLDNSGNPMMRSGNLLVTKAGATYFQDGGWVLLDADGNVVAGYTESLGVFGFGGGGGGETVSVPTGIENITSGEVTGSTVTFDWTDEGGIYRSSVSMSSATNPSYTIAESSGVSWGVGFVTDYLIPPGSGCVSGGDAVVVSDTGGTLTGCVTAPSVLNTGDQAVIFSSQPVFVGGEYGGEIVGPSLPAYLEAALEAGQSLTTLTDWEYRRVLTYYVSTPVMQEITTGGGGGGTSGTIFNEYNDATGVVTALPVEPGGLIVENSAFTFTDVPASELAPGYTLLSPVAADTSILADWLALDVGQNNVYPTPEIESPWITKADGQNVGNVSYVSPVAFVAATDVVAAVYYVISPSLFTVASDNFTLTALAANGDYLTATNSETQTARQSTYNPLYDIQFVDGVFSVSASSGDTFSLTEDGIIANTAGAYSYVLVCAAIRS